MKHFEYNIICEDIAHQTFVDEFLKIFVSQNAQFSFRLHEQCFYRWEFTNKSYVLNLYQEVAARSFKEYGVNLLFIITDFDDWNVADFGKYHDQLHNGLQKDIQSNSIVLLPVRAIEFWLWHLNWLKANPDSTKNISIDNKSRAEIKKEIYGTKKPYKELTRTKVIDCMQNYNEAWLSSRSRSFRHFLQRFNAVISGS